MKRKNELTSCYLKVNELKSRHVDKSLAQMLTPKSSPLTPLLLPPREIQRVVKSPSKGDVEGPSSFNVQRSIPQKSPSKGDKEGPSSLLVQCSSLIRANTSDTRRLLPSS